MNCDAKNIFLAGIGATVIVYEKSCEIIDKLVERGKLTVEDGKELSEELKRDIMNKAEGSKGMLSNMKPVTREELDRVLNEMNFSTKIEVTILNNKVDELKEKIEELSKKVL